MQRYTNTGFHRVYKRLLEGMKAMKVSPEKAKVIKEGIKTGMRSPTEVFNVMARPEIQQFAKSYAEYSKNVSGLPEVMTTFTLEFAKESGTVAMKTWVQAVDSLSKYIPFGKR
jgi:hypothetical protein